MNCLNLGHSKAKVMLL